MSSLPETQKALDLLAAGDAKSAIALLSAAADRGDGEALYQMALWRVFGQPLPRDFGEARALFERSAIAGHTAGATTHAVFAALGVRRTPDWSAAVAALREASRTSEVAARQCDLIDAMALEPDGMPVTVPSAETLAVSPQLARVRGLFTPEECAHVIGLSNPEMVASVVVDPTTGRQSPHPIRTSDGTVLGPVQQDVVVHALNLRIAAVTGTAVDEGEPLAVMRYVPGQQYRLHHDCLPGEQNQRVATLIAYLSDGYTGGETHFPAVGRSIRGDIGDAILFTNVGNDGHPDELSRHAGLPVTVGQKWICTRWIRRTRFDPWGMYLGA